MTLRRFSMFQRMYGPMFRLKSAYLHAILATIFFVISGCGGKEAAVEPPPTIDSSSEPAASVDLPPAASDDLDAGSAESTFVQPEPPTATLESSFGGDAGSRPEDSATSGLSGPLQPPAAGLNPAAANSSTSGSSSSASGSLTNPDSATPPADPNAPESLPTYDSSNPLEEAAKTAFAAPEDMKRLSKDSNLWVDTDQKRLVVDGYVAITQGPLEMFACPTGTKEHESIVAVLAKAREVHAGLLAVGANSGTPVSFSPEYRPATGQRIAIWCLWRDGDGVIQKTPAQKWVKNLRDDKPLELDWVFAGSSFWKDPESGREYYQADSGDLVCVSNFSTAMMDLPIESSQSNGELIFVANTDNIPAPGTPVRLVFVPVPIAGTDAKPGAADPKEAPEDNLLATQAD